MGFWGLKLEVKVRVRVTHQAHDPHEARLHLRREVVRGRGRGRVRVGVRVGLGLG